MAIKTGLIGFFDILGYEKLLENNEPEDISEKVIPILENLESAIPDIMKTSVDKIFADSKEKNNIDLEFSDALKKIISKIKFSIFSDTILLYLPVKQFKSLADVIKSMFFFTTCDLLQMMMFEKGLPLRGCIDYGKYYIKKSYFAGRPLIKAYKISNSLELSACVLSEELKNKIAADYEKLKKKKFKLLDLCFYDYLVPTKEGEKNYATLSIVSRWSDVFQKKILAEYVLSSFWKHNKNISMSVQNKAKNTEQWFNYLKFKSKEFDDN